MLLECFWCPMSLLLGCLGTLLGLSSAILGASRALLGASLLFTCASGRSPGLSLTPLVCLGWLVGSLGHLLGPSWIHSTYSSGVYLYGRLRRTDFLPVREESPDEVLERGYDSASTDEENGGLEYAFGDSESEPEVVCDPERMLQINGDFA